MFLLLESLLLGMMNTPSAADLDVSDVSGGDGGSQSVCDTDTFRGACADGHMILVLSARYGRMEVGPCVQISLGYVGCYSNVLVLADRRCSGRRSCVIRVPDPEFESTRPCLKELKTYLDISYTCVKVERAPLVQCTTMSPSKTLQLNVTSQTEGYLATAAMTSSLHPCGGPWGRASVPWVVWSTPGKQILLTLYDFSLELAYDVIARPKLYDFSAGVGYTRSGVGGKANKVGGGGRDVSWGREWGGRKGGRWEEGGRGGAGAEAGGTEVGQGEIVGEGGGGVKEEGREVAMGTVACRQYGIVEDIERDQLVSICGGDKRQSLFYRTTGSHVTIWLTSGSSDQFGGNGPDRSRFLIHYQIVGCEDLTVSDPSLSWFRRTSDSQALIGCIHNDVTWSVTCDNNTWTSVVNNCSSADTEKLEEEEKESVTKQTKLSQGFSLTLAAATGIITVLLALFIVTCYRLRKPNHSSGAAYNDAGHSISLRQIRVDLIPPYTTDIINNSCHDLSETMSSDDVIVTRKNCCYQGSTKKTSKRKSASGKTSENVLDRFPDLRAKEGSKTSLLSLRESTTDTTFSSLSTRLIGQDLTEPPIDQCQIRPPIGLNLIKHPIGKYVIKKDQNVTGLFGQDVTEPLLGQNAIGPHIGQTVTRSKDSGQNIGQMNQNVIGVSIGPNKQQWCHQQDNIRKHQQHPVIGSRQYYSFYEPGRTNEYVWQSPLGLVRHSPSLGNSTGGDKAVGVWRNSTGGERVVGVCKTCSSYGAIAETKQSGLGSDSTSTD